MVELAKERATSSARRDAQKALAEHLMPVLGSPQAQAVVEQLLGHAMLIEAQCEVPQKLGGAMRPGNAVATAHLLWQIPIRDAVAKLNPAIQGRVEWLLLRDVIVRQDVNEPPAWAATIPPRAGQYRFVLATNASGSFEAEQASLARVRAHVWSNLKALLIPAIGEELASKAAARALTRLAPVHRATWYRSEQVVGGALDGFSPAKKGKTTKRVATAYVLWEMPFAGMSEGMSDASVSKLKEVLTAAMRR